MKVTTITHSCDVCLKAPPEVKACPDMQVIFETEQTEGRSTKPYLFYPKNIDLCPACIDKVLAGHAIFGSGAMGNNSYYFKS